MGRAAGAPLTVISKKPMKSLSWAFCVVALVANSASSICVYKIESRQGTLKRTMEQALLLRGALARSVLRDALFPRTEYRLMWVQLKDCLPEAQACRLMVGLLDLAGNGGCDAMLAQRLAVLLAAGEMPDLEELQQEMAPRPVQSPTVTVVLPTLASYDCLLEAA